MRHATAVASAVAGIFCAATALLAARTRSSVTEGRVFYGRYCAACHGLAADGRGPVAVALRKTPSDLRRLGERYGMPLPRARIARFVDGRETVDAHGPREMPVWGERFGSLEPEGSERTSIDRRIDAIIVYLGTIQVGPAP